MFSYIFFTHKITEKGDFAFAARLCGMPSPQVNFVFNNLHSFTTHTHTATYIFRNTENLCFISLIVFTGLQGSNVSHKIWGKDHAAMVVVLPRVRRQSERLQVWGQLAFKNFKVLRTSVERVEWTEPESKAVDLPLHLHSYLWLWALGSDGNELHSKDSWTLS